MSALKLDGHSVLGSTPLEYSFQVEEGEHLVVIGQNGAGKSALLRIFAGLLPLTKGTLSIDKQIVDSPEENIFLPPHKRPTVLQLQTGAVFPHLNVAKNIAYPLRQWMYGHLTNYPRPVHFATRPLALRRPSVGAPPSPRAARHLRVPVHR